MADKFWYDITHTSHDTFKYIVIFLLQFCCCSWIVCNIINGMLFLCVYVYVCVHAHPRAYFNSSYRVLCYKVCLREYCVICMFCGKWINIFFTNDQNNSNYENMHDNGNENCCHFLTLKILNEFSSVLFRAIFNILSHSLIEKMFLWEFTYIQFLVAIYESSCWGSELVEDYLHCPIHLVCIKLN
jgi:hypothetical protein